MKRFSTRMAVLVAAVVAGASCEDVVTPKDGIDDTDIMPFPSSSGGLPGTGGRFGTGGPRASGGFRASGGVSTGGAIGAGGSPLATGGVPSTGGIVATGGVPSTGGIAATGGSPSAVCFPEAYPCSDDISCCSGRCDDTCVACSTGQASCAVRPCCDRTLPCTLDEFTGQSLCCRPLHDSCTTHDECCSGHCSLGRCLGHLGSPCMGEADCGHGTCFQQISGQPGSCCTPKGNVCLEHSDCCSRRCSGISCE